MADVLDLALSLPGAALHLRVWGRVEDPDEARVVREVLDLFSQRYLADSPLGRWPTMPVMPVMPVVPAEAEAAEGVDIVEEPQAAPVPTMSPGEVAEWERAHARADAQGHVHRWVLSSPKGGVVHETCACGEARTVPADPGHDVSGRSRGHVQELRRWTPEEDAYLREHVAAMSDEELGAALGRSPTAVCVRRSVIGALKRAPQVVGATS